MTNYAKVDVIAVSQMTLFLVNKW